MLSLERKNSLPIKRKKKWFPWWGFWGGIFRLISRGNISSVPCCLSKCDKTENLNSQLYFVLTDAAWKISWPWIIFLTCHTDQILLVCNSNTESPQSFHAERQTGPCVFGNLLSLPFFSHYWQLDEIIDIRPVWGLLYHQMYSLRYFFISNVFSVLWLTQSVSTTLFSTLLRKYFLIQIHLF